MADASLLVMVLLPMSIMIAYLLAASIVSCLNAAGSGSKEIDLLPCKLRLKEFRFCLMGDGTSFNWLDWESLLLSSRLSASSDSELLVKMQSCFVW